MATSTNLMFLFTYTIVTVSSCQEGWMSFQDSCYTFQTTKTSWSAARANCLDLGADLVVVRNKAENDFLYASNPLNNSDLWIGLSDVESETDFTWVSTECSQYENFGFGEPNNNANGEDCVELDSTNSDKWNDSPCNLERAYVCEISHFEDREPPSYGSSCPQDIHLLTKPNEGRVNVFWQPPVWTDDSFCLFSTTNSHSPGEVIEIPNGVLGKTINVEYTATDMVGRSSKCSFKMTVSNNQCRNGGKMETSDDGFLSCICTEEFSGLKCETQNITGTIENSNDQVYLKVVVVGLAITVLILICIIVKLVRRNHKPTNEIKSSNQMQMEPNKEVIDETPTTLLL